VDFAAWSRFVPKRAESGETTRDRRASDARLDDAAPAKLFQALPPSLSCVRLPRERNGYARSASGNAALLNWSDQNARRKRSVGYHSAYVADEGRVMKIPHCAFWRRPQLCRYVEPNRLSCRRCRRISTCGISQRRHRPRPADGRSRSAKFGSASCPPRLRAAHAGRSHQGDRKAVNGGTASKCQASGAAPRNEILRSSLTGGMVRG
jgi:hypothetical protein